MFASSLLTEIKDMNKIQISDKNKCLKYRKTLCLYQKVIDGKWTDYAQRERLKTLKLIVPTKDIL